MLESEKNMDNNYLSNEELKKNKVASGFATASMIFGIISLFATCCCLPFVFSGLGILFALLAKRENREQLSSAKTGMITSCIGLFISFICTVAIIVYACVMSASSWDTMQEEYQKQYEEITGEELPDYYYDNFKDILDSDDPSEL